MLMMCKNTIDTLARQLYSPAVAYIYSNPYKATYVAAKQELEQRKAELDFVKRRIAQLEQSIRTLEPLATDDSVAPAEGLSEICEQTLRLMPGMGMTARDVMNALKNRGIDVSGYSQPLAVLHTTLTRLCKPGSGFVKGRTEQGEPMYAYDPQRDSDIQIWEKL
jgi:hypothetical protein